MEIWEYSLPSPVISRALASTLPRRPRSEKRPIPEEQKDDKYFERRKRNNLAAKKSRDARKAREDEIALRACFLEKENAVLRAQVNTLREEAHSLRQMLVHKRHGEWGKT
ncbi:BZIP domain-containing protein [Caerostris darwini]|uniref:BZIP domain-containing protein n=1 Tax=Caerostris darwini TaxID=1538125 RepID=A0AAV4WXC0_9ARAC|nr:BZIP domain-containing protein [Caerostris darwini]